LLTFRHDSITGTPQLPADTPEEVLDNAPWVEAPFHADYGTNLRLGDNVYINFNCTIIDTCLVRIGSRTLIGPNVSLYTGVHPLDPDIRNGTKGPESGKEITIGEDCWLGGGITVLPGVTIGRGSVVGAASVVTKVCPPCKVMGGAQR
jgi:acetyltransferase-like isoleucine patch superfamily enzyme